jgi:hypothetical protein
MAVYQVRWFETVERSAPVEANSSKAAIAAVKKGAFGNMGVWEGNYQIVKSSLRADRDESLTARMK